MRPVVFLSCFGALLGVWQRNMIAGYCRVNCGENVNRIRVTTPMDSSNGGIGRLWKSYICGLVSAAQPKFTGAEDELERTSDGHGHLKRELSPHLRELLAALPRMVHRAGQQG